MKEVLLKKVYTSAQAANQQIVKMSDQEKAKLEETWDIEHAYYSSALEGSKSDRKSFDELADQTK